MDKNIMYSWMNFVTHSWGPINDANFTPPVRMWPNLVQNAKHIKNNSPELASPSTHQCLGVVLVGVVPFPKSKLVLNLHLWMGQKGNGTIIEPPTIQSAIFSTHVSYFGPSSLYQGLLIPCPYEDQLLLFSTSNKSPSS